MPRNNLGFHCKPTHHKIRKMFAIWETAYEIYLYIYIYIYIVRNIHYKYVIRKNKNNVCWMFGKGFKGINLWCIWDLNINKKCLNLISSSSFLLQSSSTSGSSVGGGPVPSGFKVNILESVDRIKEEFNFMQSQYHK